MQRQQQQRSTGGASGHLRDTPRTPPLRSCSVYKSVELLFLVVSEFIYSALIMAFIPCCVSRRLAKATEVAATATTQAARALGGNATGIRALCYAGHTYGKPVFASAAELRECRNVGQPFGAFRFAYIGVAAAGARAATAAVNHVTTPAAAIAASRWPCSRGFASGVDQKLVFTATQQRQQAQPQQKLQEESHQPPSPTPRAPPNQRQQQKLQLQQLVLTGDAAGAAALRLYSMSDLLRSLFVFSLCRHRWLVDNWESLLNFSCRIFGSRAVFAFIRFSFFKVFCGGEALEEVIQTLDKLKQRSEKAFCISGPVVG